MTTLPDAVTRLADTAAEVLAPKTTYLHARPLNLPPQDCPALEVFPAGETTLARRMTDGSAELTTPIHLAYWLAIPESMSTGVIDPAVPVDLCARLDALAPRLLGLVSLWEESDFGGEMKLFSMTIGKASGGLFGAVIELHWVRRIDAVL